MKATSDHDTMRDELYQEMQDALETELGISLKGKVDAIGWIELRLDRSVDVIDRVTDVVKSVMWMVTGEEPTVKFTARGTRVYNSIAVAAPEMLPDHVSGTNTLSVVMHMYPTPQDESRMKTTVGEIRRRLRCVHLNEGFNSDMCNELFTELEGTLNDELGEENVNAVKTSKSKSMLGRNIRYFGTIYVTRNTGDGGHKTYATISKTVQSILLMLDGATPDLDNTIDEHSYVSSFATIDIERTYSPNSSVPFDGYTLYVIQHLDKNKVHEAAQKDHTVEFILEELQIKLSEMFSDVEVLDKLNKISVRTPLVLTNEQEAWTAFGDIMQMTYDCIESVTGEEPKIHLKKTRISFQGLSASIEALDVQATVYLSTHGWTEVTLSRLLSNVQEAALPQVAGYQSLLDQAMNDMLSVNKTLEKAHEQAPAGAPKAIIMGLHSDVFNTVATFREYLGKLKGLKEARKRHRSKKDANALHAIAKEFTEEFAAQLPDAHIYDYSEQLVANTYDFTSVEFRVNFGIDGAPETNELWETIRNILWAVSGIEPTPAPREGDRYMSFGNDDFAVSQVPRTSSSLNIEIKIIALDENTERLDLRKHIKEAKVTKTPDIELRDVVYDELCAELAHEYDNVIMRGSKEGPVLSIDIEDRSRHEREKLSKIILSVLFLMSEKPGVVSKPQSHVRRFFVKGLKIDMYWYARDVLPIPGKERTYDYSLAFYATGDA